MTTNPDPVEVTKADREAAASFKRGQVHRVFQGDHDVAGQYLTEAFARHRIAAAKAVKEEAAALCRDYAGGHYMAQSCADAILAIDHEKVQP